MGVTANFYGDWIQLLRSDLASKGYAPPANATHEDVALRIINLSRRSISPKPRTVLVAKGLNVPPELQIGFDQLRSKVTVGDDVRPHLSTRITDPDYEDALMNDWGIHHLHLGTTLDARGFVNRTVPVLFARVSPSDAYFIAVMPHGEWANQQLVQILHDTVLD